MIVKTLFYLTRVWSTIRLKLLTLLICYPTPGLRLKHIEGQKQAYAHPRSKNDLKRVLANKISHKVLKRQIKTSQKLSRPSKRKSLAH